MTKLPASSEKNTIQPSSESKLPPSSSAYAESVRITPDRLFNAVIKNSRQGGSIGARDE